MRRFGFIIGLIGLCLATAPLRAEPQLAAPRMQTTEQMQAKSAGCVSCHTASDAPTMHPAQPVWEAS